MKFLLSGNLLRFSNFQNEVQIAAPTLNDGLLKLLESFPQLKPVLLDGQGRFRSVHRLFLNGDQLDRAAFDSTVSADDEVVILTAIAGG